VECPFREMARLVRVDGGRKGYAYMSVDTAEAREYTPPMSPASMGSPTSGKRVSYAKGRDWEYSFYSGAVG
jgi:hypothetical protein